MLSSSVHVIFEFYFVDKPIIANIFKNSQPKAPAPIKNTFDLEAKSTNYFPNKTE
jgi:hypothetical protein